VDNFIAIINPPEAAILAVGAIRRQPVVNAEGAVQIGAMMNITLSADHRAVDGALAARFVGRIKHDLENPQGLIG
jgi:pyruvate dehydrogenase E2 component (dihydrolipoamide acetyltransferase)